MLRPSRPMIRPFMSSEGSSITEAVVSAAWLAATRCSASATRLRARRLRLGLGLLLELADAPRELVPDEFLRALEQRAPSPRRRSCRRSPRAGASSRSVASLSSTWSCRTWTSRSATPCSRRSISVSLRSSSSSRASDTLLASSACARAARRSSRSSSARSLTASSRASMCASRRIVSAWRGPPRAARRAIRRPRAAREPAADAATEETRPAARGGQPDDAIPRSRMRLPRVGAVPRRVRLADVSIRQRTAQRVVGTGGAQRARRSTARGGSAGYSVGLSCDAVAVVRFK